MKFIDINISITDEKRKARYLGSIKITEDEYMKHTRSGNLRDYIIKKAQPTIDETMEEAFQLSADRAHEKQKIINQEEVDAHKS